MGAAEKEWQLDKFDDESLSELQLTALFMLLDSVFAVVRPASAAIGGVSFHPYRLFVRTPHQNGAPAR